MEKLTEFIKKYSHVLVFILLEVAAVLLIVQNTFYQRSHIVSVGNGMAGLWYKGVSNVSGYFGLKAENERLVAENAALRAQMASSYISYSDSVFTVYDTVYKQRYSYTDAQVIKNSWNKRNNYLMLNKGTSHGVKVDQAVISPQGIVGVVVNTTKNFSTVMPVLHANSRNSVRVKRLNSVGSLVWEGGDFRYAVVEGIPTTHKLFENDTIVSSGLANDFPEGIAVGYIESFESESGSGFYKIKVRLATDFNNLSHVYIVDNHFKAEQDSLMRMTKQNDE